MQRTLSVSQPAMSLPAPSPPASDLKLANSPTSPKYIPVFSPLVYPCDVGSFIKLDGNQFGYVYKLDTSDPQNVVYHYYDMWQEGVRRTTSFQKILRRVAEEDLPDVKHWWRSTSPIASPSGAFFCSSETSPRPSYSPFNPSDNEADRALLVACRKSKKTPAFSVGAEDDDEFPLVGKTVGTRCPRAYKDGRDEFPLVGKTVGTRCPPSYKDDDGFESTTVGVNAVTRLPISPPKNKKRKTAVFSDYHKAKPEDFEDYDGYSPIPLVSNGLRWPSTPTPEPEPRVPSKRATTEEELLCTEEMP